MTQLSVLSEAGACAARPPIDELPRRLGSWRLVRLQARGRFCHVYQAVPDAAAAAAPQYAVKLLAAPWDADPLGLELLRREARASREVPHPHLAPVLSAELRAAPYYLVQPLLPGRTLAAQTSALGRPALAEALWIARQAAEAIAALDAAGWMHADVKPDNLLIAPDGHATLLDLGFARRHEEMTGLASRPALGTLDYMAPEMLSTNLPADSRSDVYSLGAVLYEMLTGRLPLTADDAAQLAVRHRQDLPRDVRAERAELPLGVARLVRRMLLRQPLRRPSPPELVRQLAALEIECFADRPLERAA